MKGILEFIGLVVVVFLVVAFFVVDFSDLASSDGNKTIKEKIEIIELAKNSDDPVVQQQGVIAKKELQDIQNQKLADAKKAEREVEKELAAQKRSAAEAERLKSSPFFRFMDYILVPFFVFTVFFMIALLAYKATKHSSRDW